MSCMWWAPLYHWGNAKCEGHNYACETHMRCTWVHELYMRGSPCTIEGMLHVRALLCMWVAPTHELYVRGSPTIEEMLHVRALLCTWATREVHVSTWAVHEGLPSTIEEMLHVRALPCTWATRELYMRSSPPTHWGMLHVRALPCMWATHELYVRGSTPPLRECYTWGHYCAHEPPMRCMSVCELYVRGSPSPLRKCYMWGHYPACEPHVSHTWAVWWEAPLHHWGNATCEGITMHMSHTWAVCEGLHSTIEEMLHVALPCTWATCEPHMRCTWVHELYVRGSPHHWGKCYMWGHYHARKPTHELYMRGSPPPLRECYTWGALPCMWATHDSHVCALLPSTFQKSDQKTVC